jgi:hypothetical protein
MSVVENVQGDTNLPLKECLNEKCTVAINKATVHFCEFFQKIYSINDFYGVKLKISISKFCVNIILITHTFFVKVFCPRVKEQYLLLPQI